MKRFASIIRAAMVLISIAASITAIALADDAANPGPKPKAATTRMSTTSFVEDGVGFSVDYPADWTQGSKLVDPDRIKIALVPPGSDGDPQINFMVNATKLKPDDLKMLGDMTVGVAKDFKGKIVSDTDTKKLDGVAARNFSYTIPAHEQQPAVKCVDWMVIKDGKVYEVLFTGSEKKVDPHVKAAVEMVRSFRWITKPVK